MIGATQVREILSYDACIGLMSRAMSELSVGNTKQLLRSVIPLRANEVFAIMPGAMPTLGYFGAKLVSVFRDCGQPGRSAHRGLVVLFESETGRPIAVVDAEEITLIRTASASAVATDALARPDASRLCIVGTGLQAAAHVRALAKIRELSRVTIWGRSPANAVVLARGLQEDTHLNVEVEADLPEAVAGSDIVCTVTASPEPILEGRMLRPGTHVNLVGSSGSATAEADIDLVRRARFVVDSRQSALAQAGEFLRAKSAGVIGDDHIVAEIGEVLLGRVPGRTSPAEITVYKSLGHAVQDIASAAYLYEQQRHD